MFRRLVIEPLGTEAVAMIALVVAVDAGSAGHWVLAIAALGGVQ
jgi:hypothetical protein